MKIITPLVLFGLGLVLGVLAFVLYPSAATEVAGPDVPFVGVASNVPLQGISYSVIGVSSDSTRLEIKVFRDQSRPVSRASGAVDVTLNPAAHAVSRLAVLGHRRSAQAVYITVNVADYGTSFNGTTASVAIPTIDYIGSGTPAVEAIYPIPSASSYDWSSLPTSRVTSSSAAWTGGMTRVGFGVHTTAYAPGQVAIGINHARQATDSNKTFVVGALLGLAGGAILSAVQEALHARD